MNLNPAAEVPTLEYNGLVLSQSMAIIEFLDEEFPIPELLPKDAFKKAKIRQFCENINSFLHPISNLKVLQYLEKNMNFDQTQKNFWVAHWYQKGLTALEVMLSKYSGKFCFGDQVTMADVFLIPLVFAAQRFNVPITHYAHLVRINNHCMDLTCFQEAHPYNQPDTPDSERNFSFPSKEIQ